MENKLAILESENQHLRDRLAELEPMRRLAGYLGRDVWAEVLAVLDHGEVKHPGTEWNRYTARQHFDWGRDHATASLRFPVKDGKLIDVMSPIGREAESGRYHLAHAIVRYAMALAKVMRSE